MITHQIEQMASLQNTLMENLILKENRFVQ
jgi:hypothetical protein